MTSRYDLSVIIVAWNVAQLVDECLSQYSTSKDRLRKQILFVDNGSSDGTEELVRSKYPQVTLLRSDTNLGFIRANNLAYPHAAGRYVLMLNSDAFVGPHTFARTVEYMDEHPEVGVLGCRLVHRTARRSPCAQFSDAVEALRDEPGLGPRSGPARAGRRRTGRGRSYRMRLGFGLLPPRQDRPRSTSSNGS